MCAIVQGEDGADHDSPEEGTPASPRTKRRVGRPGRKRKQLLPVSTVIIGCRRAFYTPHCGRVIDYLIHLYKITLPRLKRYVKHAGTLFTFMHSHLRAAEWQLGSAFVLITHKSEDALTALIKCHI